MMTNKTSKLFVRTLQFTSPPYTALKISTPHLNSSHKTCLVHRNTLRCIAMQVVHFFFVFISRWEMLHEVYICYIPVSTLQYIMRVRHTKNLLEKFNNVVGKIATCLYTLH